MRNGLIAMALAASMEAMQRAPGQLATAGHIISVGSGNNFNAHQAKNKSHRRKPVSKYTPHQGDQERARRLSIGSAAWKAAQVML